MGKIQVFNVWMGRGFFGGMKMSKPCKRTENGNIVEQEKQGNKKID